jgi:hypothetical protein
MRSCGCVAKLPAEIVDRVLARLPRRDGGRRSGSPRATTRRYWRRRAMRASRTC